MAKLHQTFDASQHQERTPLEVLPPGDYNIEIINSELRDTKDGLGQYLWLDMQITDGPFSGRHIYDRLNLYNANKQAADIANSTLTAISNAVGIPTWDDSEVLHFKPLIVAVKVKPAGKDRSGIERDAQNEVRGYKPLKARSSSIPSATSPAAGMTTTSTQNGGNASSTPPWRRNV